MKFAQAVGSESRSADPPDPRAHRRRCTAKAPGLSRPQHGPCALKGLNSDTTMTLVNQFRVRPSSGGVSITDVVDRYDSSRLVPGA
jgi:hypothetical protein